MNFAMTDTSNIKDRWPYNLFGIECNSGWEELYRPLIDYVEEYNKKNSPISFIEIHQIKEKFAGLRVYWGGYNVPTEICDEFQKMVEHAESESYHVCEQCGTHENVGLVIGGWYYTVCEDCLKKMIDKYNRSYKWKVGDKIYTVDKNGKTEQAE